MNKTSRKPTITRRRALQLGAGALAAGTLRAPAALGQAKKFAGTTVNVSCWSSTYSQLLAAFIPEFEKETGMRVNYETPAFPVYNQRMDLELSTKGSAFDVANVTFIYSSRWIGAGWFTPLAEFFNDRNLTPPDWNPGDFLEGVVLPMRDKNRVIHAFPWIADCGISAAARFDLLKAAGLGMPQTFAELETAAKAVHRKEGVAGFLNQNNHGWDFVPYLMGFGGGVFRNPPTDLMPVLDTPEAIQAADFYCSLFRNYAPSGALAFDVNQMVETFKQGRANLTTNTHAFLLQLGDPATSKVAKTVNYDMQPGGPKGRFPGVASHGWGIPAGAKNKQASWEFIKWSLSKDMLKRLLVEKGYGAITRRSVIDSPEFKVKNLVNGVDLADLYLRTIEVGSRGYMAYRTVNIYPQVNTQLNKAIELIVSNQMSAAQAMKQAQEGSVADIRRAGVAL
jgi:multiple sugar transport system substrate-binding protein